MIVLISHDRVGVSAVRFAGVDDRVDRLVVDRVDVTRSAGTEIPVSGVCDRAPGGADVPMVRFS